MRNRDLQFLNDITLEELERTLDEHTRELIPVNRFTAFSWSVSRHGIFEWCKRRYYLNYYGSRRLREVNDPVISAVWWLKQITDVPLWMGTVMHDTAARAVEAHRDGYPLKPESLMNYAVTRYREGIDASLRGTKHDTGWITLFDHAYGSDADIDHEANEARLKEMNELLLASDAYQLITSLPPQTIAEVDVPFQSFTLYDVPTAGDVRVFAIPDVLLVDGDQVHIIDWKTGNVTLESIRDQIGVYLLYAHQEYNIPEDAITVHVADIGETGRSVLPQGGMPTLAESRAFVEASIAAMVEQMDYLQYNTVAIENFPLTDDTSLCVRCPFRRACWRHENDA